MLNYVKVDSTKVLYDKKKKKYIKATATKQSINLKKRRRIWLLMSMQIRTVDKN